MFSYFSPTKNIILYSAHFLKHYKYALTHCSALSFKYYTRNRLFKWNCNSECKSLFFFFKLHQLLFSDLLWVDTKRIKRNTSPTFEWAGRWKLLWCWPGFGLVLLLYLHVICLFEKSYLFWTFEGLRLWRIPNYD